MNNIFINRAELKRANNIVNDILQSNLTTEGKMLNVLAALQDNIKVNYKSIDNKDDEINYNFRTFQNNCHKSVRKIENTITLYENARTNAVNYINNQIGEIK